jgi:hypothetical protein
MPSLSASLRSNVRSDERARARHALAATALSIWLSALCSVGCRDMREDANYCSTCASGETSDGTMTGPQSTDPGSESSSTSDPPSSSGGRMGGSMTSTSNQAGTGNGSQAASGAAQSGGASATSGSSGVPTAGARGPQAGTAARDANSGSGGSGQPERDAGNGDTGPIGMRDAGSQEPTEPEPTPDAGPTTPPLPCNGPCPNDRPVCDETKAVPQCVQCTAQEQFACVGATSTCDVEQQKCVQCTPDDARHCDSATPTCNQDNRCVVCTRELPTSCPVAQPLCDNEQRCVVCLPGRTEYCPDNRTMCNADGQCVECMDDSQCGDPAKPRCDRENNSCVGCDRAQDCARFPGASVCDEESKRCVACSPTGDLCAVGQYCDPGINQCVVGMPKKRSCEPCNNNSDCGDSPSIAACLEGQQDNGRFCFGATPAETPLCEPGYTAVRGPAGIMYCMPINSLSCTAINNELNNKGCDNANDCGRGGQCPMPPPDNTTCKLSCSDPLGCPAPLYCDVAAKTCMRQ